MRARELSSKRFKVCQALVALDDLLLAGSDWIKVILLYPESTPDDRQYYFASVNPSSPSLQLRITECALGGRRYRLTSTEGYIVFDSDRLEEIHQAEYDAICLFLYKVKALLDHL